MIIGEQEHVKNKFCDVSDNWKRATERRGGCGGLGGWEEGVIYEGHNHVTVTIQLQLEFIGTKWKRARFLKRVTCLNHRVRLLKNMN